MFRKTSELLHSTTIWVEETNDSLILVTSLHKEKCGARRLQNEFRNKH